jgi:hypothetical protein
MDRQLAARENARSSLTSIGTHAAHEGDVTSLSRRASVLQESEIPLLPASTHEDPRPENGFV